MSSERRDRGLVFGGAIGAVLAAICCLTPVLAVGLGAISLAAWAARADYILIPVLLISLGLLALGLYRRRGRRRTGER